MPCLEMNIQFDPMDAGSEQAELPTKGVLSDQRA